MILHTYVHSYMFLLCSLNFLNCMNDVNTYTHEILPIIYSYQGRSQKPQVTKMRPPWLKI